MKIHSLVLVFLLLFAAARCGKCGGENLPTPPTPPLNPPPTTPPPVTPPPNPPPTPAPSLWRTTAGDELRNILVNPSSEVYVNGVNRGENVVVLAKFDPSGTLLWRYAVKGSNHGTLNWITWGFAMGSNQDLYLLRREYPPASNNSFNFVDRHRPTDGSSVWPSSTELLSNAVAGTGLTDQK